MNILKVLSLLVVLQLVLGVNLVAAKGKDSAPGQTKKATVGNVEDVSGNNLTVTDKQGNKETKSVDRTTKLVGQDKKVTNIKQIKVKDKVAILTDEESSDSGKVKKANKVYIKDATAAAQLKKKAVQGVITMISGSTLTVAHQIQRDRTTQVQVTASTLIKMKNASGAESDATGSGGVKGLAVGMRIVAMGEPNGDVLVARRIHVIPGKAVGIFRRLPVASGSGEPVATPSATPVATPSATPTASPSGTPTPVATGSGSL